MPAPAILIRLPVTVSASTWICSIRRVNVVFSKNSTIGVRLLLHVNHIHCQADIVMDSSNAAHPNKSMAKQRSSICCEPIDTEHLSQDNGDNCEQVVKFCYDDTGAKIDSACPDCSRNICEDPSDNNGGDDDDWHKLEWCNTETKLESCAASMGGELYCDGTLPSCEQQQERICSLTDDSGVFAKCRYNITCDCDAYHCTDNSITIEGVNEEFLDRLKPRTNDLKKIYGDNLNFYIGGGHPEAFR